MIDPKKYTNVSTASVGELDGLPIRPCMKSGFCCTKAPCDFGEWDPIKQECKFLGPTNDIGQRDCGRYEFIMKNAPNPEYYPGFGAGCCMPLFNELRDKIIKTIKNGNK